MLQRQSDRVQAFLLQTSILARLSGPLCDAVTGQGGGKAMLEALDRGNLFLVPLDDRRQWYRYHHLFADVLQARLLDEQPDLVPALHQRASAWYQQNGEPAVAIGHALAAGDFERAADLAELEIPAMSRTRQEAMLRGWLEVIPDDVVRVRPVLSVGFAGALLLGGELKGVESRLRDAERWLDVTTGTDARSVARSAEMIVADEEEYRRLPGMIELYRAALALARGDVPGTVRHARRALEVALADDHLCRAGASGLLGLAFWASGDLEAGHSAYAECMAGLRRAGHIADTFGCAIALADIRLVQGRLGEATRTYEQALLRVPEHGGPVLRGTADMYVGMSEVHRERNDLHTATQQLLRSQELGEHTGLPRAERSVHEAIRFLDRLLRAAEEGERAGSVIEILVLRALAYQRHGDIPAALSCLERAVTLAEPEGYVRAFADEGPPMASLLRVAVRQQTGGTYVRHLLAAVTETEQNGPVKQALIEPLSERELDVLRLLGTELDGPAIARELMVSLNTVRTHTKHIYAKLAVTNRRAAVRRAAELDLPRTRNR